MICAKSSSRAHCGAYLEVVQDIGATVLTQVTRMVLVQENEFEVIVRIDEEGH